MLGITDSCPYASVPAITSAAKSPAPAPADPPGGKCRTLSSTARSSRSVTTAKYRCRLPTMVTNDPTATSSSDAPIAPSSRTSSPRDSDPPTTTPSLRNALGFCPFRAITPSSLEVSPAISAGLSTTPPPASDRTAAGTPAGPPSLPPTAARIRPAPSPRRATRQPGTSGSSRGRWRTPPLRPVRT